MQTTACSWFSSRNICFFLSWIAYASIYFLRKPFGVTKNALGKELNLSEPQLGWMDAAFLLAYSVMQILCGNLGDKFLPKRILSAALFIAAISMVTFSLYSNWYVLCVLLVVNGLAQSVCWPACGKIVGSLYEGNTRRNAFGVLNTSAFAGAVLSTYFAVYIQTIYGWKNVYPMCSFVVAGVGLLVLFGMRVESSSKNATIDSQTDKEENVSGEKNSETKLGFLQLLRLPMVIELCLATLCIKFVRYSMYMWLPMFLTLQLAYTDYWSGILSTVFDIGGVIGSVAIGPIINRLFGGVAIRGCAAFILLSAIAFIFFILTSHTPALNIVCLLLAGVFNSGPDGILAGLIPTEIGKIGNSDYSGAIIGLVNGFGSLGAVLEGPSIGQISHLYGWNAVIFTSILISVIGGIICARLAYKQRTQVPTVVT